MFFISLPDKFQIWMLTDLFFRWAVFKSFYWIKKIVKKSRFFLDFEKENDFMEYLL